MKIKTSFFTLILVLVLYADESNATYSVWGLRRLITEASNHASPPQNIPPVPGPNPNAKELESNSNDGAKSKDRPVSNDQVETNPMSSNKIDNKTSVARPPTELPASNEKNDTNDDAKSTKDNSKDPPVSNDPVETNPMSSNKTDNKTSVAGSPPTELPAGNEKNDTNDDAESTKGNEKDPPVSNDQVETNPKSPNKNDNKTSVAVPPAELPAGNEKNDTKKEEKDVNADVKSGKNGSCEGSTKRCKLLKNLTACIQSSESRSMGLVLLILNEGESTLKVNISMATSRTDEHLIPEKKSEKINISSSVGQGSEIYLKAGNEECTLHVGPVTVQSNFFEQLPSFYKQITPIYIAYFIFLVTLVVGVTCACCQLRKRKQRQDGGVPYQELEMGISESASATNIETAEGWDDGWDDDWDDEKAVKSPGHRAVGISANGLTARSSKQDGWGKDWDD